MSKAADDGLRWLRKQAEGYRKIGQPKMAEALELLLSGNPEAVKVRGWLVSHQPVDAGEPSRDCPEDDSSDSSLDAMLKALATIISQAEELTSWERLPAKGRNAYCDQVARLAGELAELLEKDPRPDSTFLEFGAPIIRSGRMPALLRKLSEHMQTVKASGSRDSRPNTPSPDDANARTLARELAAYFDEYYERTPYEVIASCVALRLPNLQSPPNGDDIKNWLRCLDPVSSISGDG